MVKLMVVTYTVSTFHVPDTVLGTRHAFCGI